LREAAHRLAGLVDHGGEELDVLHAHFLDQVGHVDEHHAFGRVAVRQVGHGAHVADRVLAEHDGLHERRW
jgi:hypothetical protein